MDMSQAHLNGSQGATAEQAQVWQRSRKGRRQRGHQVSAVHDADVSSDHGLEGLLEHLVAHPAPGTQAHQFCTATSLQRLAMKQRWWMSFTCTRLPNNWQHQAT